MQTMGKGRRRRKEAVAVCSCSLIQAFHDVIVNVIQRWFHVCVFQALPLSTFSPSLSFSRSLANVLASAHELASIMCGERALEPKHMACAVFTTATHQAKMALSKSMRAANPIPQRTVCLTPLATAAMRLLRP